MLGPSEWDFLEGLVYQNDPLLFAAYDLYVDQAFGEDSLPEFCDTVSFILERQFYSQTGKGTSHAEAKAAAAVAAAVEANQQAHTQALRNVDSSLGNCCAATPL